MLNGPELSKKQYIAARRKYFGESSLEACDNYKKYKKVKMARLEDVLGKDCYDKYIAEKKTRMQRDIWELTCCPPVVECKPCPLAPCQEAPMKKSLPWHKKQEVENTMNYATASVTTAPSETQDQRKYLEGRLREIYAEKRDPLEAKFGLVDDDAPKGPKETAERIAAGKFIIRGVGDDENDARNYRYWSATDLIRWRDPAKKADQEGFAAAKKDLKAKRQEILDIIKIEEPKAGLDALKTLEAWEPTGAAN